MISDAERIPMADSSLPVLTELPPGTRRYVGCGPEIASGSKRIEFTRCDGCGGWVPGLPAERRINRGDDPERPELVGSEFTCRRCGRRLGFRRAP
jgi:hypothetical protein